jgi:hypothetical protein
LAERAFVGQLEAFAARFLFHFFRPSDEARVMSADNGE